MVERIKRLFTNEEGATMVEYALLLGLIAIVAIVAITPLGEKIRDLFQGSSDALPQPPAPAP